MDPLLTIEDSGARGKVSWIWAEDLSHGSDRVRLDGLTPHFSLTGGTVTCNRLGKSWVEIDLASARMRAANVAKEGMAYSDWCFRPNVRFPAVTRFFQQFGDEARVFTNWNSDRSWHSVSGSTFDMIFGVVDGSRIGMICIEDED